MRLRDGDRELTRQMRGRLSFCGHECRSVILLAFDVIKIQFPVFLEKVSFDIF